MADGGALPTAVDFERIRSLLIPCLDLMHVHKIPVVHKEIQWSYNEGLEQGRHRAYVANLLAALRRRNIWLSSEQKAKLRSTECPELPTMNVVFDATDADDFARRAGL